jgi:hypothetical protein
MPCISGYRNSTREIGLAALPAVAEVVALQQVGHGDVGGQPGHVGEGHGGQPLGVPAHLGGADVEHPGHLLEVGAGVLGDLGLGLLAAGLAAPAGVADQAGEVADDQDHGVAEALELGQLAQDDGVPEGQMGRGRVDAELDPQRPPSAVAAASRSLSPS